MKKILATLAITVISAFAFTDNYSINQNMSEKYKLEMTQCFDFLQKEPSTNKYFGYLFVKEAKTGLNAVTNNAYNQKTKELILDGGYGTIKGTGTQFQRFFRDVDEIMFAGTLIASSLKHGRTSIFVKNYEIDKLVKVGERKGFSLYRLNNFSSFTKPSCGQKIVLIDDNIYDKLVSLNNYKKDKQWHYNGDIDSLTAGSFKYNFKGNVELSGGGVSIYSRDSYMGYSLNRSNSLTKK